MANRNNKNTKNNTSQSSSSPPTPRLFCIRFTLFLLTITLTALSLYFSYTLTTLYNQIQIDTTTIQNLQSQIDNQKKTIDRFNTSITNADVEEHVEHLEMSLNQTEESLRRSMDEKMVEIETLLDSTVKMLNETVKKAEDEIQGEVNLVKNDVQQYVRTTQDQFSMENHFMTFQLAGTFCLLAILISMWHMTAHIRQFKRPFVQRKILAILWMSPIYAVTSWLSLVFPKFEGYLAIIKDFYEAYVIYQFLGFCISVLGRGDREEVVELLAKHSDHLDPPMRFCGWCRGRYPYGTPQSLASAVLLQCQVFAMQFVFLKPLTAVGLFSCHQFDFCDIPDTQHLVIWGIPVHMLESPVLWLKVIQNISVFMAFSGLLKFYHAVQDDLAWCNPFPKFLCIKGIVFMTFWQGLVISFLASTTENNNNNNNDENHEDPDLWGKQAQNFLICLEMLLFSIAHFYCFPTDEWQEGYQPTMEKKVKGLSDNMAFGDFVADLKLIMRGTEAKKKKKKKAKALEKKNDDLILKDDDDDNDDNNGSNFVNTSAGGNTQTSADQNEGNDVEKGFDEKGTDRNEGNEENLEGNNQLSADNTERKTGSENLEGNNLLSADNTEWKIDSLTDQPDTQGEVNESMNTSLDEEDVLDDEAMDTLLTNSIRESLSARNVEVREAAHRLLRNRMIDVDRISEGSGSRSGSEGSKNRSLSADDNLGLGSTGFSPPSDSQYGAFETNNTNEFHSEYASMGPMGGSTRTSDDQNVSETTSLLGKSGEKDDKDESADKTSLRPSIFTTVGNNMGAMNNFG